jgi:predicted transcriptional regulator
LRLSGGELEIMAMLWEQGPLTLSESHQRFGRYGRPVSYPTMQTRLNRLVQKGHVTRSRQRPANYRPAITADQVGAGHLDQLLDKLGRNSVVPLVAHLISERSLSPDEVRELKRLLARAEDPGN